MSLIAVRELAKSFPGIIALDEVSFQVGPGVTVLLGPNGAGKTTLLRCLATVMRPDHGEIEICSIPVGSEANNREVRGQLGYMPQAVGFTPGVSVGKHLNRVGVLKGIVNNGEREKAVAAALVATDLTAYVDRKVQRLSGGTRRRLALAQALLGSPRVLVLDEPTAGLDPEQRARFRAVVGSIGASGASILIATHQVEDVLGISGSVVVLGNGRVLYEGAPIGLAELARGRVWLTSQASPGSVSWPTPDGRVRTLGDAIQGEPVEPTVEDGYLLLMQQNHADG